MSDGAASALAGDFTPTAAASSGLDGVVGSAVEPAVANPTSEAASTSPSAPPAFPPIRTQASLRLARSPT